MKNVRILCAILIIPLVCILLLSNVEAKKGHKKNKQQEKISTGSKSTPPGWSKGKKTGWRGGSYPPGWSKWDKAKQNKWIDDSNTAISDISIILNDEKINLSKQNEILDAFSTAIAGGLAINQAKDKLVNALKDPKDQKRLMIDTTQTVLELLK